METSMNHFLLFQIDDQNFAINLNDIERVVRAVEVTQVPSCDKYILGIVDVQGDVIQAINTRKLLGLLERETELSDQFIIVKVSGKTAILVVDSVLGVSDLPLQSISVEKNHSKPAAFIDSAARFRDSLVLLINLEKLVSLIEQF